MGQGPHTRSVATRKANDNEDDEGNDPGDRATTMKVIAAGFVFLGDSSIRRRDITRPRHQIEEEEEEMVMNRSVVAEEKVEDDEKEQKKVATTVVDSVVGTDDVEEEGREGEVTEEVK